MYQKDSAIPCCENPKELKDNKKKCTKAQIKNCHGDSTQHPSLSHRREDQQ